MLGDLRHRQARKARAPKLTARGVGTWVGLLVLIVPAVSCRRDTAAPEAGRRPRVFVSISPQAFFVEQIAGEHIEVEVLVGPGRDPHTFEPTPKQMVRLTRARLYLRIGVPFEHTLVERIAASQKELRVVDIGAAVSPRSGSSDAGHDDHTGHSDPHTWLSPKLASIQARAICGELCKLDPAHEKDYTDNLETLVARLDRLDKKIAEVLAPLKGRTFYVFHPAFGHFAEAYGLQQQAVETGGKSPGPKHVKDLVDRARREGVKVIFVQPQFSKRLAETVAAQIGGTVVPMDPLARDYVANLEAMAEKIRIALTSSPQ